MQHLFESLGLSQMMLVSLASIGLTVCVVIEHSQMIAKYNGALKERIARGYNDAMKMMVLNRFGSTLFFLFISISIDLGTTTDLIAIFFAGAIFLVILFDLFVTVLLTVRNKFKIQDLVAGDLALVPVALSMVASLFGILGITLPMLLSSANQSLRLTMANTGFILNSVFTILVVFFVESHIAKLIDGTDERHKLVQFVIAVFFMRFVAASIALLIMLILFYHPNSLDLKWLLPNWKN